MRLVLAHEARRALLEISIWTETNFGKAQAQRYVAFLRREAEWIAEAPGVGRPVEERTGHFYVIARWRKGGYGHVLVYTVEGETVYLTNIFHTSQDWRTKIEEP